MSECFDAGRRKMATFSNSGKASTLSKAEYLKRYLSGDGDAKKEKKTKKNRIKPIRKGMKIVDDDVHWEHLINAEEKENQEEEDEEAPVVAEVIDERPEEVKRLEEFRNSQKWKRLGATDGDSQELQGSHSTISSGNDSQMEQSSWRQRDDSSDVSPPGRQSPDVSPPRRQRHDSPELSPARKRPPSLSPQRQKAGPKRERHDSSSPSPPRRAHASSMVPKKGSKDSSPSRRKQNAVGSSRCGNSSDLDLSPPRNSARRSPDSDLSPPRKRSQRGGGSDSDLSPPRRRPQKRGRGSDSDLSPPRRTSQTTPRMLSGGAAGLVSLDVLRKEQEENRRREKNNQPLEEASRNAETVFRDKSGKRRDIDLEREEQRRKAGEKAERDEKYAQWGRGLAQGQMQQQNAVDALREAEKPLARHADDEDLDRMLREQERDGDPMAGLLRKKKEKDSQRKGVKERPRYKGPPPPPNRFNLMPGYRWDGVDRSNGFEQRRYSRIADKKAIQETAYKWSVEDM
ncbi:BUD13 homolog [Anguilla rostrata]|uniref:BUD13 homolog n=1 Tax=Anguilla rostrata TaxID=7938 RepID=UPI0030CA8256